MIVRNIIDIQTQKNFASACMYITLQKLINDMKD